MCGPAFGVFPGGPCSASCSMQVAACRLGQLDAGYRYELTTAAIPVMANGVWGLGLALDSALDSARIRRPIYGVVQYLTASVADEAIVIASRSKRRATKPAAGAVEDRMIKRILESATNARSCMYPPISGASCTSGQYGTASPQLRCCILASTQALRNLFRRLRYATCAS